MLKTLFFILLALLLLSTTVSAGIIFRDRRAIEDYWYSNGVVNNMVSDTLAGGPSTLGWAQVPHLYSPMFSI
ncbi:Protein CBG10325 [Caenorhabditis briggsae]|nr:Protein CBG10325 [Caenorhabditis briggsae]CAP29677.1 Protein CBG10325 [Caenorhabditis briggsae]